MKAKDEITAALLGPAPCDGCHHRFECGSEKLACQVFQRWANTGRHQELRREPTHKIYRMVFPAVAN
ncbi:hypothetical protein [Acidithiobacillus thiooxidans]|uniref:Uncharacterized protein n=1 Tax=Acidithiobacillus thiooxidans TaxID=930 RepID=A0A1C2IQF8_ACITH|nr:hypothetical protein [Acidithiobacillus thiooxidans]OCX75547.1 hypothetical protein A6M23_02020 [Acidithiobacillus thiooxidans]OCX78198.1 hypothetical protein A6P08_19985 [Acidithiobacillus thiooxidans]